jgi:2-hydroxychromene-2-carboxylate isomerase
MAKVQDDLVTVVVPKQSRDDTQRFVAVNGERIIVQTGIPVQVPRRFAEVLENSERMAVDAERYIVANAQ